MSRMPVLKSSQPHLAVSFNSPHDNSIFSPVHISFYNPCSLIKHLFVISRDTKAKLWFQAPLNLVEKLF